MERTRARPGSLLRKLALSLAALAVCALAIEGAVRIRQWKRFGTFGRVHELVNDPDTGLAIPEPGRRTGSIAINSLGFRSPELERPKPAGRLRLAFLGGSTTFCAEASSNEATWPHLVWAELSKALPGASLDYVNASAGGYTLDQLDQTLRKRVAPLEPDVIVFYEATNDLTRDTRALAQQKGVYRGHADEDSWLARWSLAWYLLEKNYVLRARQEAAQSSEGRLEFEPRTLSVDFRRRLEEFVRASQERARLVVLLTFAPRVRKEQSPEQRLEACKTSLYYMPYMTPDGLLAGFDEYNRIIREVAAASGALLIDTAGAIPADAAHYNDSVHLKDEGCRAMAERVVRELGQAPAFRALTTR